MMRIQEENACPYSSLQADEQEIVYKHVRNHVRQLLVSGPHNVLEFRRGLIPEEAGAFPTVLEDMVRAGEIAALGHCVYARVPWMPANRTVLPDPVQDLVFASLTRFKTAEEIGDWLGLNVLDVRKKLYDLEIAGLVRSTTVPRQVICYRIVSFRIARQIKRGAANRLFMDVAPSCPEDDVT